MTGMAGKGNRSPLRLWHMQDAAEIVQFLRKGLDYSRIDAMTIVLLERIENNCETETWLSVAEHSKQLQHLAQGWDYKYVSDSDRAYRQAIVDTIQGALCLSKNEFDQAIGYFCDAQGSSRMAHAWHGEGIALLAQGIAHQHKNKSADAQVKPDWSPALRALESSLRIFQAHEDSLQVQARERLIEINALLHPNSPDKSIPPQAHKRRPSPEMSKGEPIPIVARIAAGEPILAEENIEKHIIVDADIAEKVTFGLEVRGYSMIDAGILDGDLVLIEKREDEPPNGYIAAVTMTEMDVEGTLKRFYREQDHVRLDPANDDCPILIAIPGSISAEIIRLRYEKSHHGRKLIFYATDELRIAGWARVSIRKIIKEQEILAQYPQARKRRAG
jgi:SOS-response transcriptional repressor LexA